MPSHISNVFTDQYLTLRKNNTYMLCLKLLKYFLKLLYCVSGVTVETEDKTKKRESEKNKWPKVAPEIMRIASERHQKGLMSPWIYQVLSQVNKK